MGDSLSKTKDNITKSLDQMVSRSRNPRAFLNTVIYSKYQDLQMQRWMSEGASEGARWSSLTPKYRDYKLVKFASFPGQGRKMMIATGRLVGSVIGPKASELGVPVSDHNKVVTNTSITVSTSVPYAKYPNEKRPFFKFSKESKQVFKDLVRDFLKERG